MIGVMAPPDDRTMEPQSGRVLEHPHQDDQTTVNFSVDSL